MNYPRQFFEVNLLFAQKVAELSGQTLDSILLQYTNLYIRFGLGRDFDATNSIWQEYLEGLHQVEDTVRWTHEFYLKRQQQIAPESINSRFGCFSYTIGDGNRIRLHFHNSESLGYSPLSKARMNHRLAELKTLFAQIKQNVIDPTNVIGASWLYNLEAYCRLFPPDYLATAQVGRHDFAYLPLWGQFIDHYGRAKQDLVARFLECLDKQHCFKGIEECFPFKVLHLESPIQEFYQFYRISASNWAPD